MHPKLADRVRYFKENEEGVQTMSGIVEELIDEEKREMTVKLLKNGKLSKKDIAEISGLDIEVVENLEKEQKAVVY